MSITRLVRFVGDDNNIYYGDANSDLSSASTIDVSSTIFESVVASDARKIKIKKLLCPLSHSDVRSIICIGLNYRQHAEEAKMAIPTTPVVFFKPVTALTGPSDPIVVPKASWAKRRLDYETEMVIVIGKTAKRVPEDRALDYVFGYCVGNDFSNRTWQLDGNLSGGQWCFSKAFDTSAPIGPAIVSTTALGDAADLRISGALNGVVMQDSNTNDMIFGVKQLVSFLSQGMTLLPGTLIFTGTPQGVGMGRTPTVSLSKGDRFRVSLAGVGAFENIVEFEE